MASFLIDKGTYLTLILISLNAFLFAGGAIVGQNNTDASSNALFSFFPVKDANTNFSASANLTPALDTNSSGNQTFLVTAVDFAKSILSFIQNIPAYATQAINILLGLLFAWAFILQTFGIPFVIQWALIIPVAILEIITLTYWFLQLVGYLTKGVAMGA